MTAQNIARLKAEHKHEVLEAVAEYERHTKVLGRRTIALWGVLAVGVLLTLGVPPYVAPRATGGVWWAVAGIGIYLASHIMYRLESLMSENEASLAMAKTTREHFDA